MAAGVAAGLVPLAIGFLGVLVMGLVLVWAAIAHPRFVVLSGVFAGIGATWLVLASRATFRCSGANTATEGCVGPDLSGWWMLPFVFLVLASALALVAALRRTA